MIFLDILNQYLKLDEDLITKTQRENTIDNDQYQVKTS